MLDGAVRDGVVTRWFPSVYEAEQTRFGGADAMDAVHEWFDRDTSSWFVLDALRRRDRCALAAEPFCLSVANHLVATAVTDPAEAPDVWHRYVVSLDLAPTDERIENLGFDEALRRATQEERAVLEVYRDANELLSGRLRELWSAGKLAAGIRAILANVILFHFHRHGFGPESHARAAWSALALLGRT